MAITLKRTTLSTSSLKVILSVDDAIDWENSFPALNLPEDGSEPATEEEKRARYLTDYDESELAFFEEKFPTVFVFKHPKQQLVFRAMADLMGDMQADKAGASVVLYDVVAKTLTGVEDGPGRAFQKFAVDEKGTLEEATMQALIDGGYLGELANFYFTRMRDESKRAAQEKKLPRGSNGNSRTRTI